MIHTRNPSTEIHSLHQEMESTMTRKHYSIWGLMYGTIKHTLSTDQKGADRSIQIGGTIYDPIHTTSIHSPSHEKPILAPLHCMSYYAHRLNYLLNGKF